MSDASSAVPASRWAADAFLRAAAAVRRFNADQVELRARWLRRHGVAAPATPATGRSPAGR